MSDNTLIEDPAPLQTQHIPSEFVGRETVQEQLEKRLSESSRNLFLYGRKGTGKTHLVLYQLNNLPDKVNTCYIPCRRCNTQYKALKQLYQAVTEETINSGHHTATLQRQIEERTTQVSTVVVLDDIEFLLMNDGNSLLYQLSRTNSQKIKLVLTSANYSKLSRHLEERTLSSLQPYQIEFKPYTAENIFQILAQRCRDSLKTHSVRKDALTYIASTTQNTLQALTWLKTAANNTSKTITEETVKDSSHSAHHSYVNQQLQNFTQHHQLLHQAIEELEEEQNPPINTGDIYQRYKELSKTHSENPVSQRRLSTYLKHLEHLNLIQAQYHYGGQQGKTRQIQLDRPT